MATLALGTGGGWRPPELEVRPPPPLESFEDLEEIALGYLGRPYVMGGVGSPGFDCSGFVCRVYAESGYALPRVSRDQARAGLEVPIEAVRPGDLLFFAEPGRPVSHVGLYLGDGAMIHASSGQGEVVVASLEARWFRERLVGARRVLTSSVGAAGPVIVEAPVRELEEHGGRFSLPPMLRRPPRRPPPAFGPELAGAGATAIGVRSAVLTEAGVLGAVIAPEASLRVRDWAFEAAVAVPIRFEAGDAVSVGTFERWQDYTRFVREVRLGLRGADLELRLSRFGDATLGTGLLVDRLAPGTAVRGVPGLTVTRSPLSFFGRWRTDALEVEALLDDAVDPAVIGASAAVPLGPARFGASVATDQQARFQDARRAFNAGEAFATLTAFQDRLVSVDLGASAGFLSALGSGGAGGVASARGQWRPRGDVTLDLEGRIGVAGPRFFTGLFGPAYLAHRETHAEALAELGTRGVTAGRLHVGFGRLGVGAAYGQGFGANRHPLDRRLEGWVELTGLALSSTRRLDLRAVFLSRAPFDDGRRAFTAHGGARVTLASWAFAELYVQKSETWEGGGGLTITWAP